MNGWVLNYIWNAYEWSYEPYKIWSLLFFWVELASFVAGSFKPVDFLLQFLDFFDQAFEDAGPLLLVTDLLLLFHVVFMLKLNVLFLKLSSFFD